MGYHTEFLGGLSINVDNDDLLDAHLMEYQNLYDAGWADESIREKLQWKIINTEDEGNDYVPWAWGIDKDEFSDEGNYILIWDGEEKFYNYVDWLDLLLKKYFKPWGWILNGTIVWKGEDGMDAGVIIVKDNDLSTVKVFLDGSVKINNLSEWNIEGHIKGI